MAPQGTTDSNVADAAVDKDAPATSMTQATIDTAKRLYDSAKESNEYVKAGLEKIESGASYVSQATDPVVAPIMNTLDDMGQRGRQAISSARDTLTSAFPATANATTDSNPELSSENDDRDYEDVTGAVRAGVLGRLFHVSDALQTDLGNNAQSALDYLRDKGYTFKTSDDVKSFAEKYRGHLGEILDYSKAYALSSVRQGGAHVKGKTADVLDSLRAQHLSKTGGEIAESMKSALSKASESTSKTLPDYVSSRTNAAINKLVEFSEGVKAGQAREDVVRKFGELADEAQESFGSALSWASEQYGNNNNKTTAARPEKTVAAH